MSSHQKSSQHYQPHFNHKSSRYRSTSHHSRSVASSNRHTAQNRLHTKHLQTTQRLNASYLARSTYSSAITQPHALFHHRRGSNKSTQNKSEGSQRKSQSQSDYQMSKRKNGGGRGQNNQSSNQSATVFSDPTVFTDTLGLVTGHQYKFNRPAWATDLSTSLFSTPTTLTDPQNSFPDISAQIARYQNNHPPTSLSFRPTITYSDYSNFPTTFDPKMPTVIKMKRVRPQKVKMSLLVSYRGTGYYGSQIQFENGVMASALPTIEGDLFQGLCASGLIDPMNADDPHKTKWSRAARTDKGVHAASNSMAVKLRLPYEYQIPEVMFVYKRAMIHASYRYSQLIPHVVKTLGQKILVANEAGDNVTQRQESATDITPEQLDEYKQILNNISEHVAMNLFGQVTLSPKLRRSLVHFTIFPSEQDIDTFIATYNDIDAGQFVQDGLKVVSPDELSTVTFDTLSQTVRKHHFTQWEQLLLKLVAQPGLDWERNDDEIALENYQKLQQLQPHEQKQQSRRNNNNNNNSSDKNDHESNSTTEQQTSTGSNNNNNTTGSGDGDGDEDASAGQHYISSLGFGDEDLAWLCNSHYLSDIIRGIVRPHISKQIHIASALKVAKSFDAKINASSRTYEYIIPSYAFMPISQLPDGLHARMMSIFQQTSSAAAAAQPDATELDLTHLQWQPEPPRELLDFRLSKELHQLVENALHQFVGTQNYWNFTSRKEYTDGSANRYIRACAPVGVFYVDNVEFVHIVLHGDSFLLNQIRKMVGFAIGVVRGNFDQLGQQPLTYTANHKWTQRAIQQISTSTTISPTFVNESSSNTSTTTATNDDIPQTVPQQPQGKPGPKPVPPLPQPDAPLYTAKFHDIVQEAFFRAFGNVRYNLPIAPALGLLLDHVHYDTYDSKQATNAQNAIKARKWNQIRDSIFSHYTDALPFIHQIKQREIYQEIGVQELSTHSAWRWLHMLNITDMTKTMAQLEQEAAAAAAVATATTTATGTTDGIEPQAQDVQALNCANTTGVTIAPEFRALNRSILKNTSLVDVHGLNNNNNNDTSSEQQDNGNTNDDDDNNQQIKRQQTAQQNTKSMTYVQLTEHSTAALPVSLQQQQQQQETSSQQ